MTVAGAIAAGIAFVHQELNLFDNLDAAANVFIGREPLRGGPLRLVDRRAARSRTVRAALRAARRRLRARHAGRRAVAGAAAAGRDRQGAVARTAALVIMDEPTSSLTLTETDRLLRGDRRPAAPSGVSVIFISHRLDEVKACADRVVVLRDGRLVGRLGQGRDHARRR